MSEAFLPVRRPGNISTFIQQFDAVEVQHQGIGHEESTLSFPSALEFLLVFEYGIKVEPQHSVTARGISDQLTRDVFGVLRDVAGCSAVTRMLANCQDASSVSRFCVWKSYFDLILSQFVCVVVEPLFS